MTDRLVIGTGWYADSYGHNNPAASRELYDPSFFSRWYRNIHSYIDPDAILCYESLCPTSPMPILTSIKVPIHFIKSITPNSMLHHGHDGLAAIMTGAQFAYLNKAHFLYIEQDCMVHGLDKMIAEQVANKVALGYGFGENASFKEGWAEYSLLWVHKNFTREFIVRMINTEPHLSQNVWPEIILHETFQDFVTPFANGYGRVRPIDFSKEWFYAQQLTDEELLAFEQLAKRNCENVGENYFVI